MEFVGLTGCQKDPILLRTVFLPKIPELCLTAASQNPYPCHLLDLRELVTAGRNLVYFAYKHGARPSHRLIIHPMLPTISTEGRCMWTLSRKQSLSKSLPSASLVTPQQPESLSADTGQTRDSNAHGSRAGKGTQAGFPSQTLEQHYLQDNTPGLLPFHLVLWLGMWEKEMRIQHLCCVLGTLQRQAALCETLSGLFSWWLL